VSAAPPPRPSAGARYAVERAEDRPDAVIYRGFVHLPDRDLPLEVQVARPSGAATARVGEGARVGEWAREKGVAELEKAAAALVRAATKAALASGGEPPRKIVRWRGD
jgi:hypothetical protein